MILLFKVYPFLAVDRPITAEILVIEGWLPAYAIDEAVEEFRQHPYQCLVTVGGPLHSDVDLDPDDTYAHVAAAQCRKRGLNAAQVEAVPAMKVIRDRTFSSAVATREWLQARPGTVHAINVVTLGPHARRSRLLFEKAMRDRVQVGIIAIQDHEYDPRRWWQSSEGVKEVSSEALAYLYARFFFTKA